MFVKTYKNWQMKKIPVTDVTHTKYLKEWHFYCILHTKCVLIKQIIQIQAMVSNLKCPRAFTTSGALSFRITRSCG